MSTDDAAGPGGRWERYPGGTRNPKEGLWASLGAHGQVSLTAAIAEFWPVDHRFFWVDYDAAAKILRLSPTQENVTGVYRWVVRYARGATRVPILGALRKFDLMVPACMTYPAAWVDGTVHIDIAAGTARKPRKTPTKAPAEPRDPKPVVERRLAECADCGRILYAQRGDGGPWVMDEHVAPDKVPCYGAFIRLAGTSKGGRKKKQF